MNGLCQAEAGFKFIIVTTACGENFPAEPTVCCWFHSVIDGVEIGPAFFSTKANLIIC